MQRDFAFTIEHPEQRDAILAAHHRINGGNGNFAEHVRPGRSNILTIKAETDAEAMAFRLSIDDHWDLRRP